MRVLLTGASGFIGRHATQALLARDHEVTALVRRPGATPAGAAEVTIDFADRAAVSRAVEAAAPEAVVHLAARLKGKDASWEDVQSNVTLTACLLEACRARRPAFVYTSTMCVYDFARPLYLPVDEQHPFRPGSVYGEMKLAGEFLCRAYAATHGTACIVLRLPGVYGPGRSGGLIGNLLAGAASGETVKIGSLESRRDFLYVKDAAAAVVLAVEAAAAGTSVSCNVAGSSEPVARIIDAAASVVGRPPRVTVDAYAGGQDFYFDGRLAAERLGVRPRSLEQAIADFWTSQ